MKKCNLKTKDAIAFMMVTVFCVSIFLPEFFVSQETMAQFERLLNIVIGFYFGTHVQNKAE